MDAGAFSDEQVLAASKGIDFYLVDGTRSPQAIQGKYDVKNYPAALLCDPAGKVIDRITGVIDASAVVKKFQELVKDHTWSIPWQKDLAKCMEKAAQEKMPVVVWIPDTSSKSAIQLGACLHHPIVRKTIEEYVLFSGEFERKGELAEKLGVSSGGTLLILDATCETPYKPVKRIGRAKTPEALSATLKKILDKTKLEMRVRRS